MTDSNSFSSLLALVDSHLSKSSIQVTQSDDRTKSIPIPLLNGVQRGLSDTRLSHGERLPIPTLSLSDSPIKAVLAEQVSNMLKAKERKLEEEKQKLEEEMRKLKLKEQNDDCVIDLMKALQVPFERPLPYKEVLSSSSSFESLLLDSQDFKIDESPDAKEPLDCVIPIILPCKTDMSYILNHKIRKGKCSAFGKVLTARLKAVPAPYLREKINTDIVRFDFKTKSPCDLIKEKLRKPTTYNNTFNRSSDEMQFLYATGAVVACEY